MPLPGLNLSDQELYPLLNKAVLPAWALLALFPRAKLTSLVATLTALAMSLAYALLLANHMQTSEVPMSWEDMQSLEGLAQAFKAAGVLLPAWTHYLAHDLWVGKFIVADACNKRVPRLVMLPVLALALLFGPIGALAYFVVVRPLFGKSAVTPKAPKAATKPAAAAAPAPAPAKQQPAPAKPTNGAAAPEKKNGSAAPKQQQRQPAKKPQSALAAAAAAVAATEAAPTSKAAAAAAAAKPAPKPPAAPAADIEDDRAFALASAALLRSRAKPSK